MKHYYFDQFLMWDMQKKRGFRSVAYVLNGRGGRTGARTTFSLSKRLIENAPGFAEIGIHYNYKYSADRRLLDRQKKEIDDVLPAPCISGRAHYLCFDPLSEFPTLAQAGILLDESVGWPYDNSYRCGIAGPFAPIEENGMANHNVLELPMTFMDADLPREDGSESTFSAMLDHICEVGGCLTILVHPGACSNPERPDMDGVYQRVLERLVARKARSYLPADLRAMWKVD